MRPHARREQLLFEKVGDELVIYDLERQRLHQLNRAAALVWRNCDGRKTVAELKKVLQKELSPAADEAVVWKALDRLGKAHLLKKPVPPRPSGMTRRQALGTFGRTAALALLAPVVTSITAPTPLHAQQGGFFLCSDPECVFVFCVDQCDSDYGSKTTTGKKPCTTQDLPTCKQFTDCQGPDSNYCGQPPGNCPQKRCTKAASPSSSPLGTVQL